MKCVSLLYCSLCRNRTDLGCGVCETNFCEKHIISCCSVCEEAVCTSCYVVDKCCTVKPRGKTEQLLRNLYKNKILDKNGLHVLDSLFRDPAQQKLFAIRTEAVKRTLEWMCDTFDASFAYESFYSSLIPQNFPSILPYLEVETTKAKFIEFLQKCEFAGKYRFVLNRKRRDGQNLGRFYLQVS